MNILMMTNTYTPFLGGVSRSVTAFTHELREMGHEVIVVAPEFEDAPREEEGTIRVPALQHFNGSDFSVSLPIPGYLSSHLEKFKPNIVHSHHPHLLGSTALRIASWFECPLVFTHHTMYEDYLHYVPAHARQLRRFVINLVRGYCNLCDHVIAPSESVAEMIRQRGVTTSIDVVPTGVYTRQFERGDGAGFRRLHGISDGAFVVGYVGRLAPEKNLSFLAEAVRSIAGESKRTHFVVVGSGPSAAEIWEVFREWDLGDRLHLVGSLEGRHLVNAYHAMDVFAFASHTETQGMVLTEALAAGRPVVAVDASGVREVVQDRVNGRLLAVDDTHEFAAALAEIEAASPLQRRAYEQAARATAADFSMEISARKLAGVYEALLERTPSGWKDDSVWGRAREEIKAEWELMKNVAEAATLALK
jgi:glycosyltransferase involved in cell wall biosynthesis